jgi:uncharacterized protein YidB (DUF937 family)
MGGVNRFDRTHFLTAGAGFVVGAVIVAVILLFATPRIAAAIAPSPSPTPYAAPSATPSPRASANPATKAVAKAVAQSLADSLGMNPADLRKALRQGSTVQQLATQKGISQSALQTSFDQDLKTQLDKAVAAGTITSDQESKVLTRYQSTIPHWDKPVKHAAH